MRVQRPCGEWACGMKRHLYQRNKGNAQVCDKTEDWRRPDHVGPFKHIKESLLNPKRKKKLLLFFK